jgi:hypothetical protein
VTVLARQSDPATSHAAAASVHSITIKQYAVWQVVRKYGPVSGESLVSLYHRENLQTVRQSDSGIRTRLSELADAGLVRVAGEGTTRTGRRCQLWRAA